MNTFSEPSSSSISLCSPSSNTFSPCPYSLGGAEAEAEGGRANELHHSASSEVAEQKEVAEARAAAAGRVGEEQLSGRTQNSGSTYPDLMDIRSIYQLACKSPFLPRPLRMHSR